MSEFLLLRLDAPLMSFGGVVTDNFNRTDPVPGASMLTGLLGNALGYDHRDVDALERLQARLVFGVRVDRPGRPFTDFQTVDLGQPHHDGTGWTTRGWVEGSGGGSGDGTHIRYRDYYADRVLTVALTLSPADEVPTLGDLARAVERPERPLFLGRKACLPSVPLKLGVVSADGPEQALLLRDYSLCEYEPSFELWLSAEDPDRTNGLHIVRDYRDWYNQIHAGRRYLKADRQEWKNVI